MRSTQMHAHGAARKRDSSTTLSRLSKISMRAGEGVGYTHRVFPMRAL